MNLMCPRLASLSYLLVGSANLSNFKADLRVENNPEVMSSLVHKLGLSTALSFHDVFSIDEPELLAFVPRPATALLLVFPVSKTFEAFRAEEDKDTNAYEGKGHDEPVVWYKQTIRNACGLIGILHAVSNGASRDHISMLGIFLAPSAD